MCLPLHEKWQNKCFWVLSVCALEMHNAKKYICLEHPKRILCTKNTNKKLLGSLVWLSLKVCVSSLVRQMRMLIAKSANKRVFGYLVLVHTKCTIPENACFWCGVPNGLTSEPSLSTKVCWTRGVCAFEMCNARKCVFPVWRAQCAYVRTKSANKSVFRYVVWVCLKCVTPKKYAAAC